MVLIIVVALLVLAYFGFNLRSISNSPTFQDNWSFIKGVVVNVWTKYLKAPFDYIWNKVFLPLIWEPAIKNLTRMKDDGTGVILPESAPHLSSPPPVQ